VATKSQTRLMADAGLYGIGLTPPGVGHNSGEPEGTLIQLDIDVLNLELGRRLERHEARRDELLAAVARFDKANPAIRSDDVQQRATDFVRQLRAWSREVEEHRKFEKLPVLNAQRAVDNLFADFAASIAKAALDVEAKMTGYARQKARLARELAEAVATRLRAEAAERERAAATRGGSLDGAIAASQAADQAAQRATAPAAELSRVHSDLGGVASLRATVRHRVMNFDAIPRRYLALDDAAVKLAGKGWRPNDPQPIPGVEFFVEEKVAVR